MKQQVAPRDMANALQVLGFNTGRAGGEQWTWLRALSDGLANLAATTPRPELAEAVERYIDQHVRRTPNNLALIVLGQFESLEAIEGDLEYRHSASIANRAKAALAATATQYAWQLLSPQLEETGVAAAN